MIFLGINGWGVEVNISSPEKLKEFFEKNFPEQKWPKEIEDSFKTQISSITKDTDKENLFIWKGDINRDDIPTALLLTYRGISDRGIDYRSMFIYKYLDGSWQIVFKEIKEM
jgi:hypothetical protein